MSSRWGRLDRVADRRRQDEVVPVSVVVLDGVEVHDRSPGDAELVAECGLRLADRSGTTMPTW